MEATLVVGGEKQNVLKGRHHPDHLESESDREIPEEDLQRAQVYGLLARLLAEPMSDDTLATLRAIEADDATDFGRALVSLAALARRTNRISAEEEYSALFIGDGSGGELLPYASHYLTGFLLEKPLADLRRDLAELGIAASGASKEPEDHVAFLCEVMHGMITGSYGAPMDLTAQKQFFHRHMARWAPKFFEDLERAKSATLYMPVGSIGKVFMAIENEAFETAA